MKTWKVTDNGIETDGGETVVCGQYDWITESVTTYIAKQHLGKLLAAPDMLEALEDALCVVEGGPVRRAIEAAIAKAKGTP